MASEVTKSFDGLPDWVKSGLLVSAAIVATIGWMEARYVSKDMFAGHKDQQLQDFGMLAKNLEQKDQADKINNAQMYNIDHRLTAIETKMDLLLDKAAAIKNR